METVAFQIVLAVVGGGVGGGFVTWWLESRSEHRRWLRDEKLRATSEFLNSIYSLSAVMIKLNPGESQPPELFSEVANSEQSRISLVAPRAVIEAAQLVTGSIADWSTAQTDGSEAEMLSSFATFRNRISDFTVAVRSDLGTGRKDNPNPALLPKKGIRK